MEIEGSNKIKKFNYKKRRIFIGMGLCLVPIVCITCMVVLALIIPDSSKEISDDNFLRNLSNYAPDTFGGIIGVVIGFLLEGSLVQKNRDLKKYKTLVNILLLEFCDIEETLKQDMQSVNSNNIIVHQIISPILSDVMDSAENLVLFYKKCVYRDERSGEKRYKLLEVLREISSDIYKYNNAIDRKDQKEVKNRQNSLLSNIKKFREYKGFNK